jgi:hypothetical protein
MASEIQAQLGDLIAVSNLKSDTSMRRPLTLLVHVTSEQPRVLSQLHAHGTQYILGASLSTLTLALCSSFSALSRGRAAPSTSWMAVTLFHCSSLCFIVLSSRAWSTRSCSTSRSTVQQRAEVGVVGEAIHACEYNNQLQLDLLSGSGA